MKTSITVLAALFGVSQAAVFKNSQTSSFTASNKIYTSSYADCLAFADQFDNTCTSTSPTTVTALADLPEVSVTCTMIGPSTCNFV